MQCSEYSTCGVSRGLWEHRDGGNSWRIKMTWLVEVLPCRVSSHYSGGKEVRSTRYGWEMAVVGDTRGARKSPCPQGVHAGGVGEEDKQTDT